MATDFLDPQLLAVFRLVLDTGTLILIWLVQLVIYPAFLYFSTQNFRRWHPIYARRVTFVVLPLMVGQLGLYIWLNWGLPSWDVLLNTVLVAALWGITFLRAVPLHNALDQDGDYLLLSGKLVALNWWRTGLWTTIWVVSIIACIVGW